MNEATEKLNALKLERGDAEVAVRDARKQMKELQKNLKRIDTRLKYSEGDDDLKTEREAVVETLADAEQAHDDAVEQLRDADARLRNAQVEHERNRLIEESMGYDAEFSVPTEYPILACQMLSAIADNLQFRFCSTQGYYEWLQGQVYGRSAGHEDTPDSEADDPNPEIGRDTLERLEELREEREFILKLRFAIERVFERHAEHIPADSTFRPQLLRRSDRQVLEDLEKRREQQFEAKREQNQKAREAAKDFSRQDLDVYKAGVQ